MNIGDGSPFRPGEKITEWMVFLTGVALVAVAALQLHETIELSQTEINFMLTTLTGGLYVFLSGVIKRLNE